MADYDVAAVGLSVPANPSPLDTYRPAISVKNNGLYDAIATGTISIYKAGLLVFSAAVTSGTINPGETGLALAASEWTPDEEADYVIYGYVTTDKDQVEPNNNLQPSTVTISGAPPPPPVVVPAHAQQHQDGGSDELSVEGLPGKLADDQTAEAHVASHQVGGSDQLSLDGLSGQAAEAQRADVHGNEAHSPDMASQAELTTHANGILRHDAATNLANRETSGDRAGVVVEAQLGDQSEVPLSGQNEDRLALLREVDGFPATGRLWGFPWPADHASMHNPGGRDQLNYADPLNIAAGNNILTPGIPPLVVLQRTFTAAQVKTSLGLSFHVVGSLVIAAGGGQSLVFRVMYIPSGGGPVQLLTGSQTLSAPASFDFLITGFVAANTLLNWQSGGDFLTKNPALPSGDIHVVMQQGLLVPVQPADGTLQLDLTPVGWAPTSIGQVTNEAFIGLV